MSRPFVRNRVTWLAYLTLSFYGYFLNLFGPITPYLKNELKLSYTVSSLHFSAFALGIIGSGLFGYRVIQRLGQWRTLWLGIFGMALGVLLLAAGHDPIVTIGASFIMGLVGSLIVAITTSIMSEQHGAMQAVAFAEANVVASLCAAVSPMLVGWFAPTVIGWRAALLLGVAVALVLRFGFAGTRLPAPRTSPTAARKDRRTLPALYWVYWTALVVAEALEFCMVFWSADYLEVGLGLAKAAAAQAVSAFMVGMILGRLSGSRLVQRFTANQVVTGSLMIASVGFLFYWMAPTPWIGVVGLFITGLGVSCLYPVVLSLVMGAADGNTVRASTFASLGSGVAIFLLPLILGRLADAIGIRSAYALIPLLLAINFVVVLGTAHYAGANKAIEHGAQ